MSKYFRDIIDKMNYRDISINDLPLTSLTDDYCMFFYENGFSMKDPGTEIVNVTDILSEYDIHFDDLDDEESEVSVRKLRDHFNKIQKRIRKDTPICICDSRQGYCEVLTYEPAPPDRFPGSIVVSIDPGSVIYRERDGIGYFSHMNGFSSALRIPMKTDIPKAFYDHHQIMDITSESYKSLSQTIHRYDNLMNHIRSSDIKPVKGPIRISILPGKDQMKVVPYISNDRAGMIVLSSRHIRVPLVGSYSYIMKSLQRHIIRVFHTVSITHTDMSIITV